MEPPRKPVLIYDGECRFCCHFVEQWKRRTGDRVEYETRENAREWILEEFYRRSAGAVFLMMPNGQFFEGAEAVFKVRAMGGLGLGLWFFQHFPGARPIANAAYARVAEHRMFFSRFLHLGLAAAGSAHELAGVRWLILRGLALIYAVVFLSLAFQITGLVGEKGLLPAGSFLDAVGKALGGEAFWRVPTLCWLNASDIFLLFLCWGGVGLALLLFLGRAPAWCAFHLWVFFLSLVNVGGDFLSFQWDALLLEAGFLAIFLAPWRWHEKASNEPVSLLVIWLFRLLLARFIFTCGLVKLVSGDPVWSNLTALHYHYFTQPLPTWIGWYAQQLPDWIQDFSCAGMFGIELILPFLIFFGRRGRLAAFIGFVFLQIMILLTGNHAYFNWLTLVLCLCLLDDRWLAWVKFPVSKIPTIIRSGRGQSVLASIAAVLVLILTVLGGGNRWFGFATEPRWLSEFNSGLHLVNGYGVFASMTIRRPELIIEGSQDGVLWKPYEFKYKPGNLSRPPAFVAPFQPRLDWQMWFIGVGTMGRLYDPQWFTNFLRQLLEADPKVLGLMAEDPFAGSRPKMVRVKLYDYHFTTWEERTKTGDWWKRDYRGMLVPELGLEKFR